jgi:cobalamin synthase
MIFVVVLVVIGGSLAVLDIPTTSLPAALPIALAAAAGAAALIAVLAIDRTFAAAQPPDDRRALAEYEMRQALQFAVSFAPALLGFVLAAMLGTRAAAVTGLVFALVALWLARPSRRRLEGIERIWQDAGSRVSALRAASNPPRDPHDRSITDDPDSGG